MYHASKSSEKKIKVIIICEYLLKCQQKHAVCSQQNSCNKAISLAELPPGVLWRLSQWENITILTDSTHIHEQGFIV